MTVYHIIPSICAGDMIDINAYGSASHFFCKRNLGENFVLIGKWLDDPDGIGILLCDLTVMFIVLHADKVQRPYLLCGQCIFFHRCVAVS